MIRRGTTPTHTFNIPFDVSFIKALSIVYSQNDIKVFTKRTKDCTMKEKTILVELSQKETLLFDAKKEAQIQLRILTTGGSALSTTIKNVKVSDSLSEEVLV